MISCTLGEVRWLSLLVLVAPACGGSGGGAPFAATTPVDDVCAMLALSDVQVLLPGAPAGTPLPPDDNADLWMHGCSWQTGGRAISLIVDGALTTKALFTLDFVVEANSNSTTQATPVSGVGDKAVYLTHSMLDDEILNAKKGNEVVSLAAYSFTPQASEASLQPLVVEALAKL
jgi:hypothetical protein